MTIENTPDDGSRPKWPANGEYFVVDGQIAIRERHCGLSWWFIAEADNHTAKTKTMDNLPADWCSLSELLARAKQADEFEARISELEDEIGSIKQARENEKPEVLELLVEGRGMIIDSRDREIVELNQKIETLIDAMDKISSITDMHTRKPTS